MSLSVNGHCNSVLGARCSIKDDVDGGSACFDVLCRGSEGSNAHQGGHDHGRELHCCKWWYEGFKFWNERLRISFLVCSTRTRLSTTLRLSFIFVGKPHHGGHWGFPISDEFSSSEMALHLFSRSGEPRE